MLRNPPAALRCMRLLGDATNPAIATPSCLSCLIAAIAAAFVFPQTSRSAPSGLTPSPPYSWLAPSPALPRAYCPKALVCSAAIVFDGAPWRRSEVAHRAGDWLLVGDAALAGAVSDGRRLRMADEPGAKAQQLKHRASPVALIGDGGQVAQRPRSAGP